MMIMFIFLFIYILIIYYITKYFKTPYLSQSTCFNKTNLDWLMKAKINVHVIRGEAHVTSLTFKQSVQEESECWTGTLYSHNNSVSRDHFSLTLLDRKRN